MYKCDGTCYDYNNGHICKHIHRVHSLENKNEDDSTSVKKDEFEDFNSEIDLSYAESVFHQDKGIYSY